MPKKLIEIHPDVLDALETLAANRMGTVQELADEAFYDLLKKHKRPVGLKASLKESAVLTKPKQPKKKAGRRKR